MISVASFCSSIQIAIASSHHRAIAPSSSRHRVIVIAPSRHRHRAIAPLTFKSMVRWRDSEVHCPIRLPYNRVLGGHCFKNLPFLTSVFFHRIPIVCFWKIFEPFVFCFVLFLGKLFWRHLAPMVNKLILSSIIHDIQSTVLNTPTIIYNVQRYCWICWLNSIIWFNNKLLFLQFNDTRHC